MNILKSLKVDDKKMHCSLLPEYNDNVYLSFP